MKVPARAPKLEVVPRPYETSPRGYNEPPAEWYNGPRFHKFMEYPNKPLDEGRFVDEPRSDISTELGEKSWEETIHADEDPRLRPYLDRAKDMTRYLVDQYRRGDGDAYRVLKDMVTRSGEDRFKDPTKLKGRAKEEAQDSIDAFKERRQDFDQRGLSEDDIHDIYATMTSQVFDGHIEDENVDDDLAEKMRNIADKEANDYWYMDLDEGAALRRLTQKYFEGGGRR